jgi:drug/metabolite transporter (DMT)-like permease
MLTALPATTATPWAAYACLAASMALVGSYVGLSKLLLAVFPVLLLAWLRFGIAALGMLHWLRRAPHESAMSPREKVLLFLQSFFGNFLFSICMLYGVAATSAVAAGVVLAGIPAAVAVMSWLFLQERITARRGLAIVLAVAGVATLALQRGHAGGDAPWWGYALLVASMLCEAAYVVIGKRLTGTLSPKRIGAIINVWGLALVTPFGLWQALSFDFAGVGSSIWLLLVFYAVAASIWSVWLWMRGQAHVPASQAGVFSVMLPIVASLLGVVWLGESFGTGHALAFGLAVAGLLVATWPTQST